MIYVIKINLEKFKKMLVLNFLQCYNIFAILAPGSTGAKVQREVTQMMRKYEGAFILLANLEEDVRNAEIEKVKNIITERQGTIEKVNEWGQRRLAYEIDKKREGYYVFVDFTSEADAVNEIDRICKISDNFVRHMITVEE